jgi:DNA-directed RNA polymerase specialized sigma24 family protein
VLSTDGTGSSVPEPFIELLLEIRQDPAVCRLARRWAGSPELARDGLQETFVLVATVRDRDEILNLRAYFCRTLHNEIIRQRRQVALVTRLDPQALTDVARSVVTSRTPDHLLPVDDLAEWRARCDQRLSRFTASRRYLQATVPGSSPSPARYRELITAIAESFLQEAFYGCMTKPELNAALRAGYPEWFDAAGLTVSTRYKRLSRARHDIGCVLAKVINAPRRQ